MGLGLKDKRVLVMASGSGIGETNARAESLGKDWKLVERKMRLRCSANPPGALGAGRTSPRRSPSSPGVRRITSLTSISWLMAACDHVVHGPRSRGPG